MAPIKTKKLVLFGASLFAQVAYECFTRDSDYEVVAFAVEQSHLTTDRLLGLPVIAIEQVESLYPPDQHDVYVAIVSTQLNRLRARLMQIALNYGYGLASYVSSKAIVWPNVAMGQHCFILEQNVLQPFVAIGDNVVLWSGNHIGHHCVIGDHVFIASHVVISGACNVGDYCFIGVNAALADGVSIGSDCFINMCTQVSKNLPGNKMYRGQPATAYHDDTRAHFMIMSPS
jgi:sugar O-acyltransferase (sialic acid O-acetyltransferase NeuD family)